MTERFELPPFGAPTPVRFPPIERRTLANGLALWLLPQPTVPVATIMLIVGHGSADDPADRHGLVSLTGDLLDEGAGERDAVALADAFARLGTTLQVDVGPDATSLAVTVLARALAPAMALVADVAQRPRLAEPDFRRVRDLRTNRLRQLRQSAGALADRAFISAIYADHVYGHGSLGTSDSLARTTIDDVRACWAALFAPRATTVIVCGDVDARDTARAIEDAFAAWANPGTGDAPADPPAPPADPRIFLVDRPGAPQSEVRVGHLGPSRRTPAYHPLVVTNALIGGQFTSRINTRLRQEQGVTYGARTSFDFRRRAGSFSCETSVQADATSAAVRDILADFEAIRAAGDVSPAELERAKASLTRGYVRNFETPGQLARAAASLAVYGLDDDTYDRFVPAIGRVTTSDVQEAAARFVRPADASIVVVGDAASIAPSLEPIGRPIVLAAPEF